LFYGAITLTFTESLRYKNSGWHLFASIVNACFEVLFVFGELDTKLYLLPACHFAGCRLDSDTENLNPEDVYDSIRKASVDIQNLSRLDGDGGTTVTTGRSPANQSRAYNPVCYQDQLSNVRCVQL
jgi:hypothetical protein